MIISLSEKNLTLIQKNMENHVIRIICKALFLLVAAKPITDLVEMSYRFIKTRNKRAFIFTPIALLGICFYIWLVYRAG